MSHDDRERRIKECLEYLASQGIPVARELGGGGTLSDGGILERLTCISPDWGVETYSALLRAGNILISLDHLPVSEVSVSLRLGNRIEERNGTGSLLDPATGKLLPRRDGEWCIDSGVLLRPKGFVLMSSMETIGIPADLHGDIFVPSSIAQQGLLTVGNRSCIVDPGYVGRIVFELSNWTDQPILLKPGMKIANLVFRLLDRPVSRLYIEREPGSLRSDTPLKHG